MSNENCFKDSDMRYDFSDFQIQYFALKFYATSY